MIVWKRDKKLLMILNCYQCFLFISRMKCSCSPNVHKDKNRKIKPAIKTPLDVTTYGHRRALCKHLGVPYLAQGCHGTALNTFLHLTIEGFFEINFLVITLLMRI